MGTTKRPWKLCNIQGVIVAEPKQKKGHIDHAHRIQNKRH